MDGYGVDITAPEPPFVLFKVLYRKTIFGTLLYPFFTLVKLLASVLGYLMGFTFGGEPAAEDWGWGGGGAVQVPVSRDARIPRPAWGPDLSMLDDEYL